MVLVLNPASWPGVVEHVGDESRPVRNGAIKVPAENKVEGRWVIPRRFEIINLEFDIGRLDSRDKSVMMREDTSCTHHP